MKLNEHKRLNIQSAQQNKQRQDRNATHGRSWTDTADTVTHSPLQKRAGPGGIWGAAPPAEPPQLVFYRIDTSQVALARVCDLYITRADKHQLLHRDPRLVLIFPVKDSEPPHPHPPPPFSQMLNNPSIFF